MQVKKDLDLLVRMRDEKERQVNGGGKTNQGEEKEIMRRS